MYFAEINEENIVKRVIVADSKEWCEQNLGGTWIKANEPLDASIGYAYVQNENKFIPPAEPEIQVKPEDE